MGEILLSKGAAEEILLQLENTTKNCPESYPVAPEESTISMQTAVKNQNADKCLERQLPWCGRYLPANSGTLFGPPGAGKILRAYQLIQLYSDTVIGLDSDTVLCIIVSLYHCIN